MKRFVLISLCLAAAITADIAADTTATVFSMVKMQVDRLPDLRLPRMGHALRVVGDELMAFGGHTDGYVPTPTAERLTSTGWQIINMVYTHDNGTAVTLPSGKVMLAGGLEKEMGIGQTYGIELYDPATHTFKGVGCLDKKRAFASAAVLASGKVVIAGNWYNDDYIECFDGKSHCDSVKPTSKPRVKPWVLRTAPDEVMIVGSMDAHGHVQQSAIVDRLKGGPIEVPLLGQWLTLNWEAGQDLDSDNCAIGDESKGEYAYLLPVQDHDGQVALMVAKGTDFALLDTACPLPMSSPWADINYFSFVVDRKAQRAYLVGSGRDMRLYVTAVDYAKAAAGNGAPVTLYYSEPVGRCISDSHAVLMPDGDLVVAGGICDSNFEPLACVFKLQVAPAVEAAAPWRGMMWVGIAAIVAVMLVVIFGGKRHKPDDEAVALDPLEDQDSKQLMQRITELMQHEQVYLQSELKLADMAAMLGVTQQQMTRCVKQETGVPFTLFANRYRVDHAKRIMQEQPDAKLASVALASGFTNETSFYRAFKAITGLTPKEWLARQ
ncbi:MAG: helix-turn-helix domain-containing protein [Muribaculaceae bacterium]|nr:helix-turn-helix domain-containing protein [Muribaculaceae bacterium]